MVARLSSVNAPSAAQLARETGISQQNLSRWLSEARNLPFRISDDGIVSAWSVELKARIIARAASFAGDELTRYLDSEGVSLTHYKRWRLALEEAGEESDGHDKTDPQARARIDKQGEGPRRGCQALGMKLVNTKAGEQTDKQE